MVNHDLVVRAFNLANSLRVEYSPEISVVETSNGTVSFKADCFSFLLTVTIGRKGNIGVMELMRRNSRLPLCRRPFDVLSVKDWTWFNLRSSIIMRAEEIPECRTEEHYV